MKFSGFAGRPHSPGEHLLDRRTHLSTAIELEGTPLEFIRDLDEPCEATHENKL